VRLLYSVLLYLLTPFVLLRLLWKGRVLRDYWHRIPERLGYVPPAPDGVAVWVHAVSVGESMAALPLIKRLAAGHPAGSVLVTTTTPTGSARVQAALGGQVRHTYVPYDLPHVVARFLDRMKPRRAIVMETELWPNLFRALAARRIPLIVANARLSPRSFAGYGKIRGFIAGVLADCTAIAAQSEADAARFRALGANPGRVHVVGNLKFDFELPPGLVARGRALRSQLGARRPVWIAASTHDGEEQIALNAHRILLKRFPDAALILVPRHPQRFPQVTRLIEASGLNHVNRAALDFPPPAAPAGAGGTQPQPQPVSLGAQVVFGDSMGELPMFFACADVAFVGGSLVDIGGHNVLEPAALGVPVLFGPHMFNFEAARTLLLEQGGARQVDDALGLAPAVSALFADPVRRGAMGKAAADAVAANRGALDRLEALLARL